MLVYQRVRDELTGDVEIFVEANVLQLGKKTQWLKIEHEHEPNLRDFWQKKNSNLLSPKCCMSLQKYLIHELHLKKYKSIESIEV